MKNLVLLLLWPGVIFAQEPIYSVKSSELLIRPGSVSLANFGGNQQTEIRLQIQDQTTDMNRLIFLDAQTHQENAIYPITLRHPYEVMSSDIDGDGIAETLIIPEIDHALLLPDETCFVIVRRIGDGFLRTEFKEFWGVWGHAADMNGDGRDEIILIKLPRGYSNLGGTGPLEIQVLEWNGSDFDLIASESLPEMYLRTRVVDLNNDGSAEIVALKSGRWDTNGVPIPHQLAVYAYTDNPQLTLLDDVEISTEYDDNMNYLWVLDQRIIIPIPEKFEEHMLKMRILRYQGYRLIDKLLIEEPESIPLKWKYYNDAPLTLSLQNQTLDLNGDGSLGHLQIVERKYLRFVKHLPSPLPK